MTTRTRRPSPPRDPAPGQRLKALRLKAGLTQKQLAEPQYTKAYISALENGLIRFSMAAGQYLATRLGVTIGDLLDGDRMAELRAKIEALDMHPLNLGDGSNGGLGVSIDEVLGLIGGPS